MSLICISIWSSQCETLYSVTLTLDTLAVYPKDELHMVKIGSEAVGD